MVLFSIIRIEWLGTGKEWQRECKLGHKIPAIKAYRNYVLKKTGDVPSLLDSKIFIEKYAFRKGYSWIFD